VSKHLLLLLCLPTQRHAAGGCGVFSTAQKLMVNNSGMNSGMEESRWLDGWVETGIKKGGEKRMDDGLAQ